MQAKARSIDFGNGHVNPILKVKRLDHEQLLDLFRTFRIGVNLNKLRQNDTNSEPLTDKQLASLVGMSIDQVQLLLQRSETAKGNIIYYNLPLVYRMALPYKNRGIAYTDLIQEGNCQIIF